ncbi:hypothetical protein [Actinomycetospora termitidis]|uniref:Uncharacterized protein n=1 Tax=Actinomycetospora termitidis TaxID=3053470 RepID=A0ABT7MFH4_9PSEU|nr:hypothetical protein [Actinomycetospora sp. Odt1-22]MDL5158924.1 hypothetical protein [Actinomycetospora sp. Odt1-22]
MGRHLQRTSRHGVRPAQLALGLGALAAMVGGSGAAVALQSAPAEASAPIAPAASVAPVVLTTAPTAPPVPRTTARPTKVPKVETSRTATTKATATKASKKATPICDLSGPPEFGDPAHPNVITNRNCGYVDAQGRERSRDRWIDDQFLDAAAN